MSASASASAKAYTNTSAGACAGACASASANTSLLVHVPVELVHVPVELPLPVYGVLSDMTILDQMKHGNVVISPFVPDNLSTSSYDVTLGEYYYTEAPSNKSAPTFIYNPYDSESVKKVWGTPQKAITLQEWRKTCSELKHVSFSGIHEDDRVILLRPNETILGHTREWIGGRNAVTTMMKARSSVGRNFIEVCKCAGWGDVGYINRWTMEITNNSQYYTIPLVVGRRIAQIVFFMTGPTLDKRSYAGEQSKYQNETELSKLMSGWTPNSMLPRMYLDREVNAKKDV